jgi:hypothetical protein
VLLRSGITYTQALDEVVSILIDGIATTQSESVPEYGIANMAEREYRKCTKKGKIT